MNRPNNTASAIAFCAGFIVAIPFLLLFAYAFLTGLANEAEIRARNHLMHQIGAYKPAPQDCVIAGERATCVVKFPKGPELVDFAVKTVARQ